MSDPKQTHWSLIRRAAEGGASERAEFASSYEPVIRTYLASRWRHSPLRSQIDDATQEVFVACFKENSALRRADPSWSGGFRAYLCGIVKNVARRFEEKRARGERQPRSGMHLSELAADDASLSRVFDRAWARAILKDAVRLHGIRAKEIDEAAVRRVELLRLKFQEGLPIREIARLWDADPTDLHRAYARGRREFAAALSEVVTIHTSGSAADVRAECARLAGFFR